MTMKQTGVERYGLFGEASADDDPEFIHIEDIEARSRLYQWRITPHVHRQMFQIVHIAQGGAQVSIEGQTQAVEGPCAVTVPGGAVHSFAFTPATIGYVLTAADAPLQDARFPRARRHFQALLAAPRVIGLKTDPAAATLILGTLTELAREFAAARPGRGSMIDWQLRVVMLNLARQIHTPEAMVGARGYPRETFDRFVRLVEDQYRQHWTVQHYAAKLALSPARLNRLCHGFAGKSAQEIIHARLILEAQRLLIYTSATTAMIAYELGFQDPAYFARFFRKRTGAPPSKHRNGQ